MYTENHNKKFFIFFVSVYKNGKDDRKKYCTKAKF